MFVNIFGGLTDCKMIGEGILMAYKELDMEKMGVPLVVRLRGTNEEIGQKLVSLCFSGMVCYANENNENRSRRAGCLCWRFTSLMVRWRRLLSLLRQDRELKFGKDEIIFRCIIDISCFYILLSIYFHEARGACGVHVKSPRMFARKRDIGQDNDVPGVLVQLPPQ